MKPDPGPRVGRRPIHNVATADDASMVTLFLQGDSGAFEHIYAKHHPPLMTMASIMITSRIDAADVVHDVFAIAMERLHQLDNPAALAAWLFQILRREVYRRSRDWRVMSSLSVLPSEITDLAAPIDPRNEAAVAIADETASIVRQSLAGLDRRDQALFVSVARQDLLGHHRVDLDRLPSADVADSTPARMTTRRMRQRLSASRSAYLVARYGQHACPVLRRLLRDWNGEFGPLIRKRILRHADTCQHCQDTRLRFPSITVIILILAYTPGNKLIFAEPRPPPGALSEVVSPSRSPAHSGRIGPYVCDW